MYAETSFAKITFQVMIKELGEGDWALILVGASFNT
jgi:hypothetical protein